jgi:hypothetical protein
MRPRYGWVAGVALLTALAAIDRGRSPRAQAPVPPAPEMAVVSIAKSEPLPLAGLGQLPPSVPVTRIGGSQVKNLNYGPELSRLFSALGTDALGLKLRDGLQEFTLLVAERKQHARFDQTALVKAWLADPPTGVKDIRETLERTQGMSEFRTELLRVAGELPSPSSDVLALAKAEVTDTIVRDGDPHLRADGRAGEVMLVTSAFGLWIHEQNDKAEAVAFTLDTIDRQPDPLVRYSVMMSFAAKFPEAEGTIKAGLAQRDIPDPRKAFLSVSGTPN